MNKVAGRHDKLGGIAPRDAGDGSLLLFGRRSATGSFSASSGRARAQLTALRGTRHSDAVADKKVPIHLSAVTLFLDRHLPSITISPSSCSSSLASSLLLHHVRQVRPVPMSGSKLPRRG